MAGQREEQQRKWAEQLEGQLEDAITDLDLARDNAASLHKVPQAHSPRAPTPSAHGARACASWYSGC